MTQWAIPKPRRTGHMSTRPTPYNGKQSDAPDANVSTAAGRAWCEEG